MDEEKEFRRLKNLLKKYDMTVKAFYAMFFKQEGRCAICSSFIKIGGRGKDSVSVDHCHMTQHIRGLLCGKCNMGLGYFDDSPAMLVKAAKYVSDSQADLLEPIPPENDWYLEKLEKVGNSFKYF